MLQFQIYSHSLHKRNTVNAFMDEFEQFATQAQTKSISQDDIGMLKSFLLMFV